MARKFITSRENALIDRWNSELIQGTVQQYVIYYGISYEESSVHDVYDEGIHKEYMPPIRIAGRCEYTQGATVTKGGHLDSKPNLSVRLHADELRDRNIRPREGDFVEHGGTFYEITSVLTDQPVYGQIDNKLEVELTCVPSREGQFTADGVTSEGRDNSHPIEPTLPRTLGDDL